MSVMRTEIAEHDVVVLLDAIHGWSPGTEGTVLNEHPAHKLVEISNHLGEGVDYLDVPTDHLRLAWECPSGSTQDEIDRKRAPMSAAHSAIGKGDEVALCSPVSGWRIATTGMVVEDHPTRKVVAISEWLGKEIDRISVPAGRLRLVDCTGEVAD